MNDGVMCVEWGKPPRERKVPAPGDLRLAAVLGNSGHWRARDPAGSRSVASTPSRRSGVVPRQRVEQVAFVPAHLGANMRYAARPRRGVPLQRAERFHNRAGDTGLSLYRPCRTANGSEVQKPDCGGVSRSAPLDRGNVDLLHAHHRIERALCFIAAGGERLGQHERRDLPGDASRTRSPGRHCRRWHSNSGRSLADRRWRSGTRRLRYA